MKNVSVFLSVLLVFSGMMAIAPEVLTDESWKARYLEEKARTVDDLIPRPGSLSEDNDDGTSTFSIFFRSGGSCWALPTSLNAVGNGSRQPFIAPAIPLFLLYQKLIFYF